MPLLSDLLSEVYERVAQRITAKGPVGLTTGIPRLDEAMGQGWNRQEISYLVGDSGIGKSWLALWFTIVGAKWLYEHPDQRPLSGYVISGGQDVQLQQRVAEKGTKPPIVVFWSLEMAELSVVVRLTTQAIKLATGVDVDSALLRLGRFGLDVGTEEYEHRREAFEAGFRVLLERWGRHIFIEFNDQTIEEFCRTLARLSEEYDVCLVVIDYFRKIEEFESDGSVAQAQETRSKQLRSVAKFYDCHILTIFDITREGQKNKKVTLTSMKGGTAAQYDADIVLTLNAHTTGGEEENGVYHRIGLIDLCVAKNRFGETALMTVCINRSTGFIEP